MSIDHLFLGFYNKTSLEGMAYLLDQSIKRGYKSKIVIRRSQTKDISHIEKNIVYINYSLIKFIAILNFFQIDLTLFLIRKFLKDGNKKLHI